MKSRKMSKRLLSLVLVLIMVFGTSSALGVQAAEPFQTEPMVSAGSMGSVALKSDGTVWAWGYTITYENTMPVQVSALTDIIAVSVGDTHSLAVESNGTVWAWGRNYSGQLGNGSNESIFVNEPEKVKNLTDVIAVTVGYGFSLALKSDGTVWAWGDNQYGKLGNGTDEDSSVPVQVTNLTDVVAISAEGEHSLAVKSDGTVWSWGDNAKGKLGMGYSSPWSVNSVPVQVTELTDVIAVSAGEEHSLALKSDGTVWSWGDSWWGELGRSGDSYIPAQVTELKDVIAISTGQSYSIALKSDGTVWGWGYNNCGELGNGKSGEDEYSSVPVQVTALTDVTAISTGWSHTLSVKSDGTVWGWGKNWFGQLGDGTDTDATTPVQVLGEYGKGDLDLYSTEIVTPISFDDVVDGAWYYEAVQYAAQNGIMVGKSDTMFEPDDILSRAMVATVLYRLAGSPSVTYSNIFTDVPTGEWYSDAIVWAYDNEIVHGYSANAFGPNDSITREQFATMMYRYADYKNYDTDYNEDLSNYTDASEVSSWAKDAMCWSVDNDIITGMTNTTLEPSSTATRAQCATILMRFITNFS